MEEARFYNCVSVPDGAPPSVSTKVFKCEEKVCVCLWVDFCNMLTIDYNKPLPNVDNRFFLVKYL